MFIDSIGIDHMESLLGHADGEHFLQTHFEMIHGFQGVNPEW